MVDGDIWRDEIRKAVLASDVMVVCLRPGFNEIGFRQQEIHWALEALSLRPPGRSFIIPFVVEPCEIPDWCERYHVGTHESRTSLAALVRAVSKHTAADLLEPSEKGEVYETPNDPPLPTELTELRELQKDLRARIHAHESDMLELGPVGGTSPEDFVVLDKLRNRCFAAESRIASMKREVATDAAQENGPKAGASSNLGTIESKN
jgi:hypothetical protein